MLKKIIFKIDWNLNKLGISIATYIYSDFANIKLFKKKKTNIFQKIYKSNFWKNDESVSGHGSTLLRASPYLKRLKSFLKRKKIKIFLDAPCGDLNWINFLSIKNMKYIGADIVPELIHKNRTKYPYNKFLILDTYDGYLHGKHPYGKQKYWIKKDFLLKCLLGITMEIKK